jgi:photosystem II stability/assembly factor-like uncharacterized protein
MSYEVPDTIICLSANGTTTSSSVAAARRMLVATTEGVVDLRRNGPTDIWQRCGDLLLPGKHVSALAYDEMSGLLFAALHFQGGVVVSTDGGKTWEARNNGLQSGHAYTIFIQHVGDQTILNLGTEPVMFYRSWDLGKTWTAFPSCTAVDGTEHWFFPRSKPHIKHIAAHPSRPERIYICVEQGDLLRTDDGGKTWVSLHEMERPDDKFRRDQHRVVFFRDNADEIFFTSGIGMYHSTNGGDTWERLTDTTHICAYPDPFFVHPRQDVLFMVGAGMNPNPKWAAEGTAHPQFMKSTDHGKSWQKAMRGMPEPIRGNLEASAMHDSREGGLELYSGTACGELYHSRDGAESWQVISHELPPMSKGPHFRHFLQVADREAYENKLRAMDAFA